MDDCCGYFMFDKNIEIFVEDKEVIIEKINNIENNILGIKFDEGGVKPNKEQKAKLQDRMEFYKVPGLGLAVINNNQLEWAKCYGVRDIRTKEKITLNTLFEAGSTSKSITAAVSLILVEKGLIDLDEDVNNKLKDWKIPENRFTAANKITLRQILTHTSGINRPDSMFSSVENSFPTLEDVLKGQEPAINDPVKVVFKPGSNHQYSNFGYIVIEKLIEDITGMDFHQAVKELLFDPLDLLFSTFKYPSKEVQKKSIVHHNKEGEAEGIGLTPGASGHGGLLTTPIELASFIDEINKNYQNQKRRKISSLFAKHMLNEERELDPSKGFGIFTGQGLGVFLVKKGEDFCFLHPGTNAPGATCNMIGFPNIGQGIVLMANGIGGEQLNLEILFTIADEYNWAIWK